MVSAARAVQLWHACVRSRSPALLDELLADDAVFYSPVVHTPQRGKQLVKLYLAAALQALGNSSFRYTKEVVQDNIAVLEFEVLLDDISVNGVDVLTWNAENRVTEFKVMIRPLKAINLVHQRMASMLESMK